MKTCLVLAILLVAAFVASEQSDSYYTFHNTQKRQISRATINVKPPPGCVFYECIAKCRQKGYRNGGYCTMTGCQCVR
ncbi:unnamed protein product, partial [Brenthis ino]